MVSFPDEFPFVKKARGATVVDSTDPPQETVNESAADPLPIPEPISPAPVLSASASADNRPSIDRRKVKRDRMETTALIRFDAQPGPPIKVELEDISVAGVRFKSLQPIDLGQKAQIRLEIGPFRWTTRLRVVHRIKDERGHVSFGCAFLRTELLRPWPQAA
jgi:hypothetical protein